MRVRNRRSSQNSDGACKEHGTLVPGSFSCIPCNLFILAFPGLDLETSVVHVVNIARGLEVTKDIVLEFADRLEEVGHVLILLDVADDFGSLGPLVEVNQLGGSEGGNTILDEGQICEIDT